MLFRHEKAPNELIKLFDGTDQLSGSFLKCIQTYNCTFSMTSLGIDQDLTYRNGGGPYVFKIRGQLYHRIGSLLPENEGDTPKFAQLWVIDAQEALQHWQALNPHLNHNILLKINDIVKRYNPYFEQFKSAFERLRENVHESNFRFTLVRDTSADLQRYNMSVASARPSSRPSPIMATTRRYS